MAETTQAGTPTVRRMALGARLRAHRERLRFTLAYMGTQIDRDSRAMIRYEGAQVRIPPEILERIMDAYLLSPEERDELRALAADSEAAGWWVPYSHVIRPTYQRFIGLEDAATGLREYAAKLVPGLLQTREYALAIMKNDMPRLPPEVIRQRMHVRATRQAEWDARQVPTLHVLDESVLRRWVGTKKTMRGQLEYIAEVARRPNTSIRIVSFENGQTTSALGNLAVMYFDIMPPVAVLESLTGDAYAEREDAEVYTRHFDQLTAAAEPEAVSLEMIEEARGRFA